MIYPTIKDLTHEEFNRYEIAIATAKCARMITNEYVRQREEAERSMTGNKETDKPLNALIDREVRDEKAVRIAIGRIHKGEYRIVHKDPAEQEKEEQAILEGMRRAYEDEFDFNSTPDEDEDAVAVTNVTDTGDTDRLLAEDVDAITDLLDAEDETDSIEIDK